MPDITISKSLNRAYRQQPVAKTDFDRFNHQLNVFFEQIETVDTEEKVKGDLMDFLKISFYGQEYKVSPSGNIDCAIHLGSSVNAPVGVIFEVKMPGNKSEMIQRGCLNRKALQEILLYWLRERVSQKNISLKKLIVTNIYEYFIFEAQEFERVFYSNKKLLKRYEEFSSGALTSVKTDFFYKDIASEVIAEVEDKLEYTWFDIRSYRKYQIAGNDRKLIELYKVFSPENLLKIQFQTDSNKLNVKFYGELLHIIGLEETEDGEGSRRVISRKKPSERNPASLIESTMTVLDAEGWVDSVEKKSRFGNTREEQLFNMAMSLAINWVNRILFMKLLEAQMIRYHKGDTMWAFMNSETIGDYDEMNKLFFQVLAKRPKDRSAGVAEKYVRIPYLNSSLFEMTELEFRTIRINNLDNAADMPLYSGAVLKDGGKPRYKSLPTLRYLLEFLDAYDFSSEGTEDINESSKTLINASVLGLIFEKINGHRDGSVFTPGAITMWMSEETLKRVVVKKFNDVYGWNCADYESLRNRDFDDLRRANEVIDSLRICDPAVGSGHFLVSALNEIIWIKYDLGILTDAAGGRIKKQDYEISIENDELIVSDAEGCPFSYIPGNAESQRVQETLFMEKRKIIENCLFGVDLNPNAVNICRLRLWIELLKNAFYTKESGYADLETLPNIDINIKAGNSLLHRYGVEQDISQVLQKSGLRISDYKRAVAKYKNAHNKDEKRELESFISSLKTGLKTEIGRNDPLYIRKTQLERELFDLEAPELFEVSRKVLAQNEKRKKDLRAKLEKVQRELDEIKNNKIYREAFEWRLEFPEVLDDEGRFVGFDCVIGNPPYIQLQKMGESADAFAKMKYVTYERTGDIYCLFYELGHSLLKQGGLLCYITSNKWMRAGYGEKTRAFLSSVTNPLLLVDFAGVKVFENATVDTNILLLAKEENAGKTLCAVASGKSRDVIKNMSDFVSRTGCFCEFMNGNSWIVLSPIEQSIKHKIEAIGKPLKDWDISINYGIKTGYNDAFIVTTEKKNEILEACQSEEERSRTVEIFRPILRGRDIKRYGYDWANLWVIFIPWHFPLQFDESITGASEQAENLFKEQYPAVYQHMLAHKDALSNRNKAETGIRYEWYAMQRWGAKYLDDFNQPKIVWGEISDRSKFALDSNGQFVPEATSFLMVGKHLEFLCCLLNSNIIEWYFSLIGTTTGVGTTRWKKYTLECIPAPLPEDDKHWQCLLNKLDTNLSGDSSIVEQINNDICHIFGLTEEECTYINDNC